MKKANLVCIFFPNTNKTRIVQNVPSKEAFVSEVMFVMMRKYSIIRSEQVNVNEDRISKFVQELRKQLWQYFDYDSDSELFVV